MRIVQLTEVDRGILRAAIASSAVGKETDEELQSLIAGEDSIEMSAVPNTDVRELGKDVVAYKIEDGHLSSLKKALADGKPQLSKAVKREYLYCKQHLEVAKEAPKEE